MKNSIEEVIEAKSPATFYGPDRIIGSVSMITACISGLIGIAVVAVGRELRPIDETFARAANLQQSAGHTFVAQNGHSQVFPVIHVGSTFTLVGSVSVCIAILQFISAVAMFRGSRKGLLLALAVAPLTLLGSALGIIIGAPVGLYTILRLWGDIGPRPI